MRHPAVAGPFYPGTPATLQRAVDELLKNARQELKASGPKSRPPFKAILCPHAGYVYSGLTAALSFAAAEKQLQLPNTTVIILGPNHTGLGNPLSVSFEDWKTPVGTSSTDLPLAGAIIKSNAAITKNEAAHLAEHSIEVQLPFLQTINPQAKIVAICMGWQDDAMAKMLAKSIFDATRQKEFSDRNLLLLASSDFTHYQSGEQARRLDAQPLEFIKALQGTLFEEEVEASDLSICGHGPIAVALHYSKLAGAKKAELLRYTNSGKETNGDEGQVVAYASFVIA
ncbi:Memo-like protein [uncultured archaeon]|nr:Memo-like protein [uncultured archaeon]